MVEEQLVPRGIENENVLKAFRNVPRHEFVPEDQRDSAYADHPLPIGKGQTISQPYIVAEMISALEPEKGDRVLEIGLGSGYAAALLAEIVENVYAIERVPELTEKAEDVFNSLNYKNIVVKTGDGTKGWPEKAPFDCVLVSAAAPDVPDVLLKQLVNNGVIVIPAGEKMVQQLWKVTRKGEEKFSREKMGAVRFVPLIGEKGWKF